MVSINDIAGKVKPETLYTEGAQIRTPKAFAGCTIIAVPLTTSAAITYRSDLEEQIVAKGDTPHSETRRYATCRQLLEKLIKRVDGLTDDKGDPLTNWRQALYNVFTEEASNLEQPTPDGRRVKPGAWPIIMDLIAEIADLEEDKTKVDLGALGFEDLGNAGSQPLPTKPEPAVSSSAKSKATSKAAPSSESA